MLSRRPCPMKIDNIRHIVVDADIAFSAGLSIAPVSKQSRRLLAAIDSSNINLAFCSRLRGEWRRHQSNLTKRWLASMVSRKRVSTIEPPQVFDEVIQACGFSAQNEAAALKDCHLIALAVSAAAPIASNDKVARKLYGQVSMHNPVIGQLLWLVPLDDCEELEKLVRHGGYVPEDWRIKSAGRNQPKPVRARRTRDA